MESQTTTTARRDALQSLSRLSAGQSRQHAAWKQSVPVPLVTQLAGDEVLPQEDELEEDITVVRARGPVARRGAVSWPSARPPEANGISPGGRSRGDTSRRARPGNAAGWRVIRKHGPADRGRPLGPDRPAG